MSTVALPPTEMHRVGIYLEDDAGGLTDYGPRWLADFGGIVPTVGDELTITHEWLPNAINTLLVVRRRVFLGAGRVVIVVGAKRAGPSDEELFQFIDD